MSGAGAPPFGPLQPEENRFPKTDLAIPYGALFQSDLLRIAERYALLLLALPSQRPKQMLRPY